VTHVTAQRLQLDGDRAAVREQTVRLALQRLRTALG
jgi:nicotinamide mononucleotide (NMN) deamidase PncC